MPRAKRKSDEEYNARRRARRLAERLEREARRAQEAGKQVSEASRLLSERIRSLVAASYRKQGEGYKEALEKVTRLTEPVRERERASRIERRNVIFKQSINAREEAERKAFWRATQYMWQGVDPTERLNEIVKYFANDTGDESGYREWLIEKVFGEREPTEQERNETIERYKNDLQYIYDYLKERNKEAIADLREAAEVPKQYNDAISKVVLYG